MALFWSYFISRSALKFPLHLLTLVTFPVSFLLLRHPWEFVGGGGCNGGSVGALQQRKGVGIFGGRRVSR